VELHSPISARIAARIGVRIGVRICALGLGFVAPSIGPFLTSQTAAVAPVDPREPHDPAAACQGAIARLTQSDLPRWPTQYAPPETTPTWQAAGIEAFLLAGRLDESSSGRLGELDERNEPIEPIDATAIVYRLDLSRGARVDLAGNLAIDPNDTADRARAAYETGRDPHVPPRSLDRHWEAIRALTPDRAFAALNGQFFGSTPVRLAFPLKADGAIVSGGYAGSSEYDGEKVMLAIADDRATIAPFPEVGYPENPLFSADIPDAIVGLHPCADKGRDRVVGRTFAGIADRDADGTAETLLFLVASHATQADAIALLDRFGAIAIVMLDGGGSTQSIVRGERAVRSSDATPRAIPHAIGLIAAPPTSRL